MGSRFPHLLEPDSHGCPGNPGEVLTYRGELIFPAYHSTSGGQTEDSENYWSALHPYLRSTPSPYEEHSPHYRTEQEVPWEEIARALGLEGEGPAIEILQRYPSGRVQAVAVGGKVFTGRQVREALGRGPTGSMWRSWKDGFAFPSGGMATAWHVPVRSRRHGPPGL